MTKAEVLEKFDFKRMHDYMVKTNWWWAGPVPFMEGYIPSIANLKQLATELLDEVDILHIDQNVREGGKFISTGGLDAFCSPNREFGLRFDRPAVNDGRLIRKGVKIPTIEAGWMYEE